MIPQNFPQYNTIAPVVGAKGGKDSEDENIADDTEAEEEEHRPSPVIKISVSSADEGFEDDLYCDEDEEEIDNKDDSNDIFTKSMNIHNLNLKNFIIKTDERTKKVSDVSEILAYNNIHCNQLDINKVPKNLRRPLSVHFQDSKNEESHSEQPLKPKRSYFKHFREKRKWTNIFCPCWYY